MAESYVTIKEVERYTGLPRSWLYAKAAAAEIPHLKVGKYLRFRHQEVDIAPYLALQRWLAAQGEQQVMIPFAEVLAELVPVQAVRMRRDFRQLLTCIQAIALLYQCQREKTSEGVIIATHEDYMLARELLAPIFDSIVSEGLTPAIRQTVEAISGDEYVSEATLAQRLKLSKSTVHYRVSRALRGGWLVNHETRKGYPASLSRGTPLPELKHVLPTLEDIEEDEGGGPFARFDSNTLTG
jgi:excisionase family DNA binding protein